MAKVPGLGFFLTRCFGDNNSAVQTVCDCAQKRQDDMYRFRCCSYLPRMPSCPAGTWVSSLTAWSGAWIEGISMTCTGGSQLGPFPREYGGGGRMTPGICGGTDGLQSLTWSRTEPLRELGSNSAVVHINATCLGGESFLFANS